jgi:hypothetical protein
MSAARTARRRRKQFVQGFTHIAKLGRPIYRKRSAATTRARMLEVIANQRRIAQKKG